MSRDFEKNTREKFGKLQKFPEFLRNFIRSFHRFNRIFTSERLNAPTNVKGATGPESYTAIAGVARSAAAGAARSAALKKLAAPGTRHREAPSTGTPGFGNQTLGTGHWAPGTRHQAPSTRHHAPGHGLGLLWVAMACYGLGLL